MTNTTFLYYFLSLHQFPLFNVPLLTFDVIKFARGEQKNSKSNTPPKTQFPTEKCTKKRCLQPTV